MQEAQSSDERGIPRVELPQTLGVVVPPGHDIEPVWNLLAAAGFALEEGVGRTPVIVDASTDALESLPGWLEQHPEGHLLLLFNAPVPTIARHMADAVEPGEAIGQWRQHAEQVLGVVRHNRRRMTLIALEAAQADPGAFTELLGNRFGLALKRPLDTIEAGDDPGAVFRMMAENAVWQSPNVRNLAAELEANALPMPPSHGLLLPAVEEVYSEFNTLVERTRARKEAYEAEPSQKQPPDDSASNARIQDLQEENELLLQQLHHVQEELESYYLNGMDARQELEEARATIEALYNSMSWKLTRPLRFVLDLFSGHRGETR